MGGNEQSHIVEWPYTQGQNEGTDRAVLPVGQFSYVQNGRYRKTQRLGKRRGYSTRTSLDAQGDPLGNGGGLLGCLGSFFCVVDDTFYRRNEVDSTWWAKPSIGVLGNTRRLWNQFPQFTPSPIIDPPTQESLEINGAPAPFSGMTTALGYVWTAEGRIYNSAWYICTTAIDPVTGLVAYSENVQLFGVATTDTPSVQLLSMPTPDTVVLLTDGFTAGVKTSVQMYTLTEFNGGFVSAPAFTCIESAANYYPTSNNRILFTHVLTGSPTTIRVGTLDPVTGAVASAVTIGGGGNKTLLSIFGLASGGVCVGYFDAAAVRLSTFSPAFVADGAVNVTATVATATAPIMFAERSAVSLYPIAAVIRSAASDTYAIDFSSAGALNPVVSWQRNALPLSQPFSIGTTQVFMWLRCRAGEGLGVATLVRVPHSLEWASGVASLPGVFPVQATVDDRDVAEPLSTMPPGLTLHSGPPFPTPRPTALGYMSLINYTRSTFVSGSTTRYMRSVALVPVRHLSEGPRYASSCVIPVIDRQFVASAQPMWVDSVSAYEAGFIQAPVSIAAPIQAGGGALTAVSTYSYTVVFESEVGTVIERSAPSVPVTVTLTGVNNAITTRWTAMELGYRRQVTAKVYRTAANGSVFYFLNKFDASPGASATGYFDFVDGFADSDIIQNGALYIQIGQEVAASNFPACAFANTGGGRLWCGGGFAGNIVQASKRFAPHLSPEFADDDAWRITLPANCTGAAWCDSEVLFTQEGIYVVSGDGPDVAGEGFFTWSRLPFNVGCIDWRSVVVCDLGIMFQSARGLYLLPRGFGTPIPMDQVIDTLTTYPIITSARSDYNSTGGADNSEQIVQWTAVADEAATSGVVITFDLAYKAFSVDTFGADYPAVFQSGWGGDAVQSPALMTVGPGGASEWHPFRVYDSAGYSDVELPIEFKTVTGDVRPWGTFGHGVVQRLGFLGEMRSACTVNVTKTTDKGTRVADPRVYTAAAPDPLVGASFYLAVDLGSTDQKDVTTLRTEVSESSTLEGVTLSAMVLELGDNPQNFKLLRIADRIQ